MDTLKNRKRQKRKTPITAAAARQKVAAVVETAAAVPHGVVTIMLDLTEQIAATKSGVEQILHTQAARDQRMDGEHVEATEHRRILQDRVSEIAGQCGAIEGGLAVIKREVERIAPIVDAAEQKRQQRLGAATLLRRQKRLVYGLGGLLVTLTPWATARITPIGDWLPPWLAKLLLIR